MSDLSGDITVGKIEALSDTLRKRREKELDTQRPTLIAYLRMKLEAEDWHGVQDAASDLRDLDSELDGLRY